jgi:2-keto-4-pentenoate hydratase/2-oxohepta-3-ene-1,7-dioic acid hydratase in catechol pathway
MRFIAFDDNGTPALGARNGEELVNLTEQGLPDSLEEFLRGGASAFEVAERIQRRSTKRRPVANLIYLPPLRYPAKAIAVGLNYRDHASESKFEAPSYPVLFQRFPSSWVAHRAAIVRPLVSEQFDYEGELVAVIGRRGRHIQPRHALEHVAGYSIFNDGSIRDYQFKSAQWMMGKNFDSSGSFGPEFVTADELPAGASGLRLRTRVNGALLQDANTRDMIFAVAALVATCSEAMTLEPGDMIISGTPAGVGFARKPRIFLKPGDMCEVEIEGIGVLSNPVADESPARIQSQLF